MDVITLAAARAYTDKKVAEGGGASGGGGLPVVEITTTLQTGATLTTEEGVALDAAFEAETPIVISAKVKMDYIYQGFIVLNPMKYGSYRTLIADVRGYTVTLQSLSTAYGDQSLSFSVSVEKNEFKGMLVLNATTRITSSAMFDPIESRVLTKAFDTATPVIIKGTAVGSDGNDVNFGMLFQRSFDNKLVSCSNNIVLEYVSFMGCWAVNKYEV